MPALQPREGRSPGVSVTPRAWQAAFLAQHRAHARPDFLLVATPGAGKTLAACQALRVSGCEQVVVVCPTTALRAQWGGRRGPCRASPGPALAQRGRRLA